MDEPPCKCTVIGLVPFQTLLLVISDPLSQNFKLEWDLQASFATQHINWLIGLSVVLELSKSGMNTLCPVSGVQPLPRVIVSGTHPPQMRATTTANPEKHLSSAVDTSLTTAIFFLDWYFQSLKDHGNAVLGSARAVFGSRLGLAAKVSGIHWWYKSSHHAAELTAGYYNANQRDAYAELADMFATHDTSVDFTCLEMKDSEQPSECASGPEELVNQVASSAGTKGIKFNGENALPRYDNTAYNKIISYKSRLSSFTYLRLSNDLLQGQNFNNFKYFVDQMHSGDLVV